MLSLLHRARILFTYLFIYLFTYLYLYMKDFLIYRVHHQNPDKFKFPPYCASANSWRLSKPDASSKQL